VCSEKDFEFWGYRYSANCFLAPHATAWAEGKYFGCVSASVRGVGACFLILTIIKLVDRCAAVRKADENLTNPRNALAGFDGVARKGNPRHRP
jgi:hypothetical protein